MSTDKAATTSTMLSELFQVGLYKPSQGRIARQATAVALILAFGIGAWQLYQYSTFDHQWRWLVPTIPTIVALLGAWFSYRIVNYPRFADFLIAVEAEMNKVSWPPKSELVRSSIVVILVILILSTVLFGFDFFWSYVFKLTGIIQVKSGGGK
jgi:preprotein translocase subunit SecE